MAQITGSKKPKNYQHYFGHWSFPVQELASRRRRKQTKIRKRRQIVKYQTILNHSAASVRLITPFCVFSYPRGSKMSAGGFKTYSFVKNLSKAEDKSLSCRVLKQKTFEVEEGGRPPLTSISIIASSTTSEANRNRFPSSWKPSRIYSLLLSLSQLRKAINERRWRKSPYERLGCKSSWPSSI